MSSRFVLLLAILLGLLFFALDLTTLDVQFWMPSLLLPIVVYRWGRRRDIYIIAAFLSLLILINYQLDEGWIFTNALFDHLMPFAVLWIMAWLLVEHRSLQELLSLQHRQLLHHGQDLADQVQARTAALEASEQKLATIFRTNPGGIAISSLADGRFLEANPAYLAMVGYTHDELVGHTSLELGIITSDDRARLIADLNSALAALQRANHLKDEFMAMISHELRTPLTGVLSMAELLEEQVAGPLNTRQSFYVKSVISSGERLLYLVNGILGYTHLLSGCLALDNGSVELGSLPTSAPPPRPIRPPQRHRPSPSWSNPPISRSQATPLPLPKCSSACSTMPSSSPPKAGRSASKPTPAAQKIPSTSWSGTRGSASTGTSSPTSCTPLPRPTAASRALAHEGLGLGLAYVDQMIRLLGGRISVTSKVGEGIRFTVTLPT